MKTYTVEKSKLFVARFEVLKKRCYGILQSWVKNTTLTLKPEATDSPKMSVTGYQQTRHIFSQALTFKAYLLHVAESFLSS